MAHAEKKTRHIQSREEWVSLDLSHEEATTLVHLLCRVAGREESTYRRYTGAILEELLSVGFEIPGDQESRFTISTVARALPPSDICSHCGSSPADRG